MKKKLLILILLVIVMGVVLGFIYKKETAYKKTDAYKFKVEYESLNGKDTGYNNNTYRTVKIDKNNKIIYSTAGEIVKKIEKNETFAVYFGFSKCPWCRSMIENLVELSNSYDCDVYYVDVLDIRDKIEYIDGEKVITKGDEDYMKLLDLMGDVLDEYIVTDSEGNEYDTNEKRIYAPNVVTVIQGKATKKVEGISEELTDPYMDLTDEMIKESKKQLECIFKCLEETGVCTKKGAC